MQSLSLDQPLNLEVHTCVDEGVEMAVCVLEGERVGIGKLLGNEEVQFRWQGHKGRTVLLLLHCGRI
jgi:hypothetical protein